MATTNKATLQEQALEMGLSIYNETSGKELSAAALKKVIKARSEELASQHAKDQQAKEAARKSAAEQVPVRRRTRDRTPVPAIVDAGEVDGVRMPNPELVKALGLPEPTDEDVETAKKYGYPVAVPGGTPVRVLHSFNCSFGAGLRSIDSVAILTAAELQHKREHVAAL